MTTQTDSPKLLSTQSILGRYEARVAIDNYTAIAYGNQIGFGHAEGFYSLAERVFWEHFPVVNQPTKVLDLGCGVGRFIYALAGANNYKAAQFIGIDYSQAMIDRASKLLLEGEHVSITRSEASFIIRGKKLANVQLEQGDAQQLPFADESFDCVHAANLLDRVPDSEAVLKEMMRVLKPGGCLIASSPLNFNGFEGAKSYSSSEILAILRNNGLIVEQHLDHVPYVEYKDSRNTSNWSCFVVWGVKQDCSLTFNQSSNVELCTQAECYKAIFEGTPWLEKWPLEKAQNQIQMLQNIPTFDGGVLNYQEASIGLWYGYRLNQKDRLTGCNSKLFAEQMFK